MPVISSNPFTPPGGTCSHLRAYWRGEGGASSEGAERLRDVLTTLVFMRLSKSVQMGTKRDNGSNELRILRCQECKRSLSQLHACLECVHFACVKSGHFKKHQKEFGHALSVDVERKVFHCAKCDDYVYDFELEQEIQRLEKEHRIRSAFMHEKISDFKPSDAEMRLIRACSQPVREISAKIQPGMRGIQNLGNSCYMTVGLQSLIANPFLRNFFLGDAQNRLPCKKRVGCVACEMSSLFFAMFNSQHKSFSPHSFLFTVWSACNNLSGYQQQDAHEFLSVVLNSLHKCLRKQHNTSTAVLASSPPSFPHLHSPGSPAGTTISTATTHQNKHGNTRETGDMCQCVVHRIFGGSMLSRIQCLHCNRQSESREAFLCLSLDLYFEVEYKDRNAKKEDGIHDSGGGGSGDRKNKNEANGDNDIETYMDSDQATDTKTLNVGGKRARSPSMDCEETDCQGPCKKRTHSQGKSEPQQYNRFLNLKECLRAYVSKENLGKGDRIHCPECRTHRRCSKQMIICRLPPTLTIQLKRFCQDPGTMRWYKVSDHIDFTMDGLDLAPYIQNPDAMKSTYPEVYDLSCVVVHKGTLENGHYLCFIRRNNLWYMCDDDFVTLATREEVIRCEAYLLFYVRRTLSIQS
mmetsp:Transcript_19692/g.27480  ORF Transcript_19692/g.27480 Transcript_19692/m.27480 type:complete len:634 (+) Transcript_19692:194-2095(+)|eukprot:CAMPEP_0184505052 /NCGR_PEP_ID=MMETSP0113_2-20130426/52785_1 /TAXON_ID=91329 /ORGANISM="Norrisiella sphaerica, Strain BC52" /LENGTH=633 /DNA_ID=CAMNT_0026894721 /DNA_START=185 /DNA_END=2086 /DNA_ORIENTATION=-